MRCAKKACEHNSGQKVLYVPEFRPEAKPPAVPWPSTQMRCSPISDEFITSDKVHLSLVRTDGEIWAKARVLTHRARRRPAGPFAGLHGGPFAARCRRRRAFSGRAASRARLLVSLRRGRQRE